MKSIKESIIGSRNTKDPLKRVTINSGDYSNHVDYINDLIEKNRYYGPMRASLLRNLPASKKPQVPKVSARVLASGVNPYNDLSPEELDWLTIGTDLRWGALTNSDLEEVSSQEAYDLSYDTNGRAKNNPGLSEYILILKNDGTLAGRILGGKWVIATPIFKRNSGDMKQMKKFLQSNPEKFEFYRIPEWHKWATDCLLDTMYEL
jgi:hypothetical protein